MSTNGQHTKCRRKNAENYNRLSRVHERYRRQTDDRQMDGRQQIANVRSLKVLYLLRAKLRWRAICYGSMFGSSTVRQSVTNGYLSKLLHVQWRNQRCVVAYKFYIVSQKTSHLWLAVTLTHMNGFLYFLAEMLPIK